MSPGDDLQRRLSALLEQAEAALEPLELDVEFVAEPVPSLRFSVGDAEALVMADGVEHGGGINTALVMVVAVPGAGRLSPRQRLRENATAALGWYADRAGRWGLRDGIPGDPLDPENLRARVHEARLLVAERPLAAPDVAGPASLAGSRALLERGGVTVTALPDALRLTTPAGAAELRLVIRDGALATVVWMEVGGADSADRADRQALLLRRNRTDIREGSVAIAPDGRTIVRAWLAGEPTSFDQLARLLAPLLTSAREVRSLLAG